MLASAIAGGAAASGMSLVTRVEAQRTVSIAKPPTHKYEYRVYIAPSPQYLIEQANQLAEDGWELTNVITDERVVTRYIGFFRREKR
jgi:hypothetical protein